LYLNNAALSPDGKRLATADAREKIIRLWEAGAGKEVGQLLRESGTVHSLAFSPDGRLLAALYVQSRLERVAPPDLGVFVWEVGTGKAIGRIRGPHDNITPLLFSPDGKSIVTADPNTIRVWEVASGQERRRFQRPRTPSYALAFSPEGRLLASASVEGTALVWDVTGHQSPEPSRPADEQPRELETLWTWLASADARRAYQALWAFVHAQDAVPFLQQRLRPVAGPEPSRLARWVTELDSDQFAVRQKAVQELEKLGELARPALRQALAAKPTLEARRRLEQLLKKLDEPLRDPDVLRALRALEVLEHHAGPKARRVLETLAAGAPEARLTREARAALERLARSAGARP
jgi:dipeptidyl aminopeptidase/acylaminoacyl peptidase